eukprot:scaffold17491_cov114-Skeletonema_marinoi.AAC.2
MPLHWMTLTDASAVIRAASRRMTSLSSPVNMQVQVEMSSSSHHILTPNRRVSNCVQSQSMVRGNVFMSTNRVDHFTERKSKSKSKLHTYYLQDKSPHESLG